MSEKDAITTSLTACRFQCIPLDDVLNTLSVDSRVGLSDDDVRTRLQKYGPNTLPKVRGSFWKVYLAPILNWLINIYLMSSVALIALAFLFPSGENQLGEATLWLSVVAINCLVAIFQQYRAQKKLEALEKLSAGESRVIRGGREMKIDPTLIVPGDIVKLEQGDKVPADGRIVTSTNLSTNEASLTGESVPNSKDPRAIVEAEAPLTDMKNMVFFGTYVSTGTAVIAVTMTGASTEIGLIQGELEELNTGDIPLRKKVNMLAKFLGIAALVLMGVSVLWRTIIRPMLSGQLPNFAPAAIAADLTDGITRAMTIMPINIPLLTTIVLLTGVLAMAKKAVIIRDLSAIESLGRVSVICSDKTGTMTRNQMTVKFCWDGRDLYTITGDGYEPLGEIYRLKDLPVTDSTIPPNAVLVNDVEGSKGLYKLVLCGVIDNDAEISQKEIVGQGVVWFPIGDPTDAALLALFRKSGLDEGEIKRKYKVVKEFPFESELKRMSKICYDGQKFIVFVKGATEVILQRCTMISSGDRASKLAPETAT
ncbi:MAG: hypothetical protein C4K49_09405, partial [Candidatus Thorarchaeota archaeon]